jgi:hypothetical protein
MPTRKAPGWLVMSVGLSLALAVCGCGRDAASDATPTEDTAESNPDRPEMADLQIPSDSIQAPLEVPGPAVAQDRAAQDRARALRHDRLKVYLTSAYNRFGRTNPRWDNLAREALVAWAAARIRPSSFEGLDAWSLFQVLQSNQTLPNREEQYESTSDVQFRAWKAARQAINAGCDDPLILLMFARLCHGECAIEFNARVHYWHRAALGMENSAYPASLRAETLARAGAFKGGQAYTQTSQLAEAQRLLDAALALIPAVARESRDNPEELHAVYHVARLLVDALRRLPEREPPALKLAFEKVDAVLAHTDVNPVDRLLLRANTFIRMACDARGNQPAWDVSTDGWTEFDSSLNRAEQALAEAWTLDPNCAEVPRLMLCVETGQDKGRERLEMWFERAMRLNGDDYFACMAKLEYLAPYWHGSQVEMLSFGRACLQTQNWDGRLPFILIEAHRMLARNSLAQFPAVRPEQSYFSRPYVWKDIEAVYGTYLATHPDSNYERSSYAKLAVLSAHYAEANVLFDQLGGNWWRIVFPGRDYENMRACARSGNSDSLRPRARTGAQGRDAEGTVRRQR